MEKPKQLYPHKMLNKKWSNGQLTTLQLAIYSEEYATKFNEWLKIQKIDEPSERDAFYFFNKYIGHF